MSKIKLGSLGGTLVLALVMGISLAHTAAAVRPNSNIICEYPAPPAGYHYEGADPETQCGAYLVPDGSGTDEVDSQPSPDGVITGD